MSEPVVVVELTSKRWKSLRLAAWGLLIVGVITWARGAIGWGMLLMLASVPLYLAARIGAWWKHG